VSSETSPATGPPQPSAPAPMNDGAADAALVAALRAGDEAAFTALIDRHHAALVRHAMVYVRDRAVAEEVAQETWLGLLRGLDGFAGRSSLKTWLFRILTNQAKRRGAREGRSIPFSALAPGHGEPAVDPDRFFPPGDEWAGHFIDEQRDWCRNPEEVLLSAELKAVVEVAIAALPPAQREVITLRDVDGFSAAEVCNVLGLSDTNQRVLLHRARAKVRRAIERQLEGTEG
jgi:RNA polymerase sigma-70 factor (ECF subfamily)